MQSRKILKAKIPEVDNASNLANIDDRSRSSTLDSSNSLYFGENEIHKEAAEMPEQFLERFRSDLSVKGDKEHSEALAGSNVKGMPGMVRSFKYHDLFKKDSHDSDKDEDDLHLDENEYSDYEQELADLDFGGIILD